MINKNQKHQNLKNNHILILNQAHSLLHHVTLGGGNESETFVLIFVIIHYSFMSRVLGSHGNESETFKNNYILILNQVHSLFHHVTLGGAMSQNEMEISQGFVMSHVLGPPNLKAKINGLGDQSMLYNYYCFAF